MMLRFAILILIGCWALSALAQSIGGDQGIGIRFGGSGGSGTGPLPCGVGVIDLSTGCPQPMLGVL